VSASQHGFVQFDFHRLIGSERSVSDELLAAHSAGFIHGIHGSFFLPFPSPEGCVGLAGPSSS
jgi:hypothetical protein